MNEQNYTKPAKSHTLRNIAMGAVLFAAGCGVGGAGSSDTPASSPAPTVTATVTAEAPKAPSTTAAAKPAETTAAPKPKEELTEWSDGVYEIGSAKDIKPGTYKARVDSEFGCYIEQTTDASGEFESIVSNDILDGKSGYVTIVAKANYLNVSGCTLTPKG